MLYRKPADPRKGKKAAAHTVRARLEYIRVHGFARGSEVSSPMGPGRILKLNLTTGELKIQVDPNGYDRRGSVQTFPATAIGPR